MTLPLGLFIAGKVTGTEKNVRDDGKVTYRVGVAVGVDAYKVSVKADDYPSGGYHFADDVLFAVSPSVFNGRLYLSGVPVPITD